MKRRYNKPTVKLHEIKAVRLFCGSGRITESISTFSSIDTELDPPTKVEGKTFGGRSYSGIWAD